MVSIKETSQTNVFLSLSLNPPNTTQRRNMAPLKKLPFENPFEPFYNTQSIKWWDCKQEDIDNFITKHVVRASGPAKSWVGGCF